VLLPLDSAGLLTTNMQHALRALRSPGGKAVLLSIMEVYLKVHLPLAGVVCLLSSNSPKLN
jgi:hypothetical protein